MARLSGRRWTFIGCVSHEERCLATLAMLQQVDVSPTLVRIFDEDPLSAADEKLSLDIHKTAAIDAGVPAKKIIDAPLLATIDTIEAIVTAAMDGYEAAIVDISSFPKRWFFIIARMINQNALLKDVVFTYSPGNKYADVLSSNADIVRTIPTFSSLDKRTMCDVAFVGIGYHSYSVLDLFDIERPKSVTMLFPFPPGPPGISRNWKFVDRLERSIRSDNETNETMELAGISQLRLAALDLPQNFNALRRVTDDGTRTSLVAPYGPKPVSLAMCLFALAVESAGKPEVPAYYSQPTRYALDYTTGVYTIGDQPAVYGYPTRLNARDLYKL